MKAVSQIKSLLLNRRFLLFLAFVAQAAVIVTLIYAGIRTFNMAVDGSSVISSKSHEQMARIALDGQDVALPENYNERVFQMSIVDHLRAMPETVVIGSSRGFYIGRETTGIESIYNNCVSGASVEDYYALLGLYRQKYGRYPSRVIVEISPWVFNALNPEARWLDFSGYRHSAEKLYKQINGKELVTNVTQEDPYYSLPYFQYNYSLLLEKGAEAFRGFPARASEDPEEQADCPDGTMRYPASQANDSPERLAIVQAAGGPIRYQDVQYMEDLDPGKREAFEHLIRDLQDRGTEVIFYLSPFSATQAYFSYDLGQNSVFSLVEDYLYEYARNNNIRLIGSYEPQQYSLSDHYFMDQMHLDKTGVSLIWESFRETVQASDQASS